MSASSPAATIVPSWSSLQKQAQATPTGRALVKEAELRKQGRGSAHVQNTLRLFNSSKPPKITLFRDHAGWCPYCEKLMLLVEEKQIPCTIELVPMRSYGDKPREFLQKVPNGLLPAMEVDGQIITESQVIMQLLDEWHSEDEGYKPMIPSNEKRYDELARLERELFSWWCTLVFRPEGGLGGMFGGGKKDGMSGSMQGFMDCIQKVDKELLSTRGPWFFGEFDYPSMIDFIYVSHVERMLASVAYWKGLNLRDPKWKLKGLNAWLDAFEKREPYLAFKSDYYTHIKDIPPQYGPGYDGGFEQDREAFFNMILGGDRSWTLPLSHDDPLQPLYRGPPLPLCILQAMELEPDETGAYESCDPVVMARACRHMAAWKLSDNGINVRTIVRREETGCNAICDT
jgi:glutathione S-transferase